MSKHRNGVLFEKKSTEARLVSQRLKIIIISSLISGLFLFYISNEYLRFNDYDQAVGRVKNLKYLNSYLKATIFTKFIPGKISAKKDLNNKKWFFNYLHTKGYITRSGKITQKINTKENFMDLDDLKADSKVKERIFDLLKAPPNKYHQYKKFDSEGTDYIPDILIKQYCEDIFSGYSTWAILKPFVYGLIGFLVVFLPGIYYGLLKKTASKKYIRGSRSLSIKEVNKIMRKEAGRFSERAGKNGLIEISWLKIPDNLMVQHMELSGDTGTGKTTVIKRLLDSAEKGQKFCIIYDIEGELTEEFYNKERGDIILDVTDINCPYWSPWFEIDGPHAKETFLTTLLPEDPKNEFWVENGRTVVSCLMDKLSEQGDGDAHDILEWLNRPIHELAKFLEGTEAANIITTKMTPQDQGQIAHLKKDVKFLKFLPRNDGREKFSCKSWVADPKGWVFLRCSSKTRATMLKLISIWIDCFAMHILERPKEKSADKIIYFFIDEMHTLNRLDSLVELLVRARKRNVAIIYGSQNVGQLRKIYGKDIAHTMLSMPVFKFIFRTSEPESAGYYSQMIGKREIEQTQESLSAGVKDIRDSISYSVSNKNEDLVMASTIQGLKDLESFFIYGKAGGVVNINIKPFIRKNIQQVAYKADVAKRLNPFIGFETAKKAGVSMPEENEVKKPGISDGKELEDKQKSVKKEKEIKDSKEDIEIQEKCENFSEEGIY